MSYPAETFDKLVWQKKREYQERSEEIEEYANRLREVDDLAVDIGTSHVVKREIPFRGK